MRPREVTIQSSPSNPKSQGKDAIRRFNLSAALAEIHERGPISRSQLMQNLRLSRTTISELVGQLTELGLVSEGDPAKAVGVGRPSYIVKASDAVGACVLNPESDAIAGAFVTLGGALLHQVRRVTPKRLSPESTAAICAELVAEIRSQLSPEVKIVGLGVAIPGQVSAESGRVLLAPRLGWELTDFGALLTPLVGMPVVLDNNARLVTQAEHRRGVARGFSDFIHVFAGAGGIGGGMVVDNHLVRGKHGLAGELGHMRISQSSARDFSGKQGTLEALVKRDELLALFGKSEATDGELDALIRRAEGEEFIALAHRHSETLGMALGSLANIFDPQLIVLGGFLGSLYRRFPEVLERAMHSTALPSISNTVVIRSSVESSVSVLIGAAELVFNRVIANPIDVQSVRP